jgi:uncharacterized phage-associated protein
MPQDSEFKLDRAKFKDVIHFVCAECDTRELGNVKLHKILYFADMLHFLHTGHPLTGVEYQKQKFGPVARHLSWGVRELCKEGRLTVQKRDYFGYEKVDYKGDRDTVPSLTNMERQLLLDVIEFVCSRSAREISELSHQAPWENAKMGETIPYYTAYALIPQQITQSDIEKSIEIAKKIKPEIERQVNEGRVYGTGHC